MNRSALTQIAAAVLRIFSIGYFVGTLNEVMSLPYEVYGFVSYRGGYYKNIHTITLVNTLVHIVLDLALGIGFFKYAKPLATFFTRGLQEHINPESEEGVWPPAPRRPNSE